MFPIGTTSVTVTASDACGASQTNYFTVSVQRPMTALSIGSVNITPGNSFQMTLAGLPAQRFAILASTNLTDWISIGTNVLAGYATNFVDTAPATNSCRYFRAVPLP
jgi:hypothetical protein